MKKLLVSPKFWQSGKDAVELYPRPFVSSGADGLPSFPFVPRDVSRWLLYLCVFVGMSFIGGGTLQLGAIQQHEQQPSRYLFHQQLNDMCMIAPMLNLPLVEQLAPSNQPGQRCDLSVIPARTRREWFAYNQKPLQVWHGAFKRISDAKASGSTRNRPLINFLDQAIEQGPVSPHFYNARGRWAFSGRKGALASMLLPFCCLDYNALAGKKVKLMGSLFTIFNLEAERPVLGLRIPLARQEGGGYSISHVQGGQVHTVRLNRDVQEMLDACPLKNWHWQPLEQICNQSTRFNRHAKEELFEQLRVLDLDRSYGEVNLWQLGKSVMGFDRIGILPRLGEGYVLNRTRPGSTPGSGGETSVVYVDPFIPYMQGLYKMMLLALGLNNQNTLIAQADRELWGVKENLQKLIREAGPEHAWNPRAFNKENFLQYEITEVLKGNANLLTRLKNVIDFNWNPWQLFQDLKYNQKYYRKNRTPYLEREVVKFLPGDEQALAFMTTLAVRELLYGACSKKAKAFYKATGTPKLPGIMTFSGFKKSARNKVLIYPGNTKLTRLQVVVHPAMWLKKPQKYSFINVWQEIKNALFARWQQAGVTRKNWISFDGHGWVASFDNRLIALQRSKDNVDRELLDQLGVVCIESWMGSELEAFYKV